MFDRTHDTLRQVLVISGLGMVLTVNALANLLPINGMTTGEVNGRFTIYFVPAAYVFAIWGLIYLFQLAYVVYQALPSQKRNPVHRRIAPWYLLISVANTVWIFLWHYELLGWAVVPMVVLLFGLINLYVVVAGEARFTARRGETWLLRAPFSFYLAWISVATVANITTWLEAIRWGRFGLSEVLWGVIMLVVATAIEGVLAARYRDPAYVGVVVWAFIGIAVRHADTTPVAVTALVMTLLVIAALLLGRGPGVRATVA